MSPGSLFRIVAGMLTALVGAMPASASHPAAPPVSWPSIPARADSALGFIPAGWVLEYSLAGELDGEPGDDILLVLKMDDPANVIEHDGLGASPFDTNPRMLVIVFADGQGRYRKALSDHRFIPRPEVPTMDDVFGMDPGAFLQIRANRSFRIGLYTWFSAGSWSTSTSNFTFRYQDGCFRMIGYDRNVLHRASGEMQDTSINYLTGEAQVRTSTIEDESGGGSMRKHRLADTARICLGQMGNGLSFEAGPFSP